jgi:hypothetical protein
MGAANPEAAARKTADIAKSLGLSALKIAAIVGDDVLDACKDGDLHDHGIRRHDPASSATGCCPPMPISARSRWRRR